MRYSKFIVLIVLSIITGFCSSEGLERKNVPFFSNDKLYELIDNNDFEIKKIVMAGTENYTETLYNDGKVLRTNKWVSRKGISVSYYLQYDVEDIKSFLKYAVDQGFFRLNDKLNYGHIVCDGGHSFYEIRIGDYFVRVGGENPGSASKVYSKINSKYYTLRPKKIDPPDQEIISDGMSDESIFSTKIEYKKIQKKENGLSFDFNFLLKEIPNKDYKDYKVELQFITDECMNIVGESKYVFDDFQELEEKNIVVELNPVDNYHYGTIFCYLKLLGENDELMEEFYTDLMYFISNEHVFFTYDLSPLNIDKYFNYGRDPEEFNESEYKACSFRKNYVDDLHGCISLERLLDSKSVQYHDFSKINYMMSPIEGSSKFCLADSTLDIFVGIVDPAMVSYNLQCITSGNLLSKSRDLNYTVKNGVVNETVSLNFTDNTKEGDDGYIVVVMTAFDEMNRPIMSKTKYMYYWKERTVVIDCDMYNSREYFFKLLLDKIEKGSSDSSH